MSDTVTLIFRTRHMIKHVDTYVHDARSNNIIGIFLSYKNIEHRVISRALLEQFKRKYPYHETLIKPRHRNYPTILTCVGFAKYLLGIKNLRIMTPMQLYYYVRTQNAR